MEKSWKSVPLLIASTAGITVCFAYVARWFDDSHQGLAMRIFGAGNCVAVATKFVAPALVEAYAWIMVPMFYITAMLGTAFLFWSFTVLLFTMGVALVFDKVAVFKKISDDNSKNIGVISGIVGLVGGFIFIIMFGTLVDLTSIRSSAFTLMYGVVTVSLAWMYWSEIRIAEFIKDDLQKKRLGTLCLKEAS